MAAGTPEVRVRERVRRLLAALDAEDLEERVAPVKCAKHPDNPECMDYYGVVAYGTPEDGTPEDGTPEEAAPEERE